MKCNPCVRSCLAANRNARHRLQAAARTASFPRTLRLISERESQGERQPDWPSGNERYVQLLIGPAHPNHMYSPKFE